jgi:hypothetical protein
VWKKNWRKLLSGEKNKRYLAFVWQRILKETVICITAFSLHLTSCSMSQMGRNPQPVKSILCRKQWKTVEFDVLDSSSILNFRRNTTVNRAKKYRFFEFLLINQCFSVQGKIAIEKISMRNEWWMMKIQLLYDLESRGIDKLAFWPDETLFEFVLFKTRKEKRFMHAVSEFSGKRMLSPTNILWQYLSVSKRRKLIYKIGCHCNKFWENKIHFSFNKESQAVQRCLFLLWWIWYENDNDDVMIWAEGRGWIELKCKQHVTMQPVVAGVAFGFKGMTSTGY